MGTLKSRVISVLQGPQSALHNSHMKANITMCPWNVDMILWKSIVSFNDDQQHKGIAEKCP